MLSWRVGAVTITRIVELEATGGSRFILPQVTREAALEIPWLTPRYGEAVDDLGDGAPFVRGLVSDQ